MAHKERDLMVLRWITLTRLQNRKTGRVNYVVRVVARLAPVGQDFGVGGKDMWGDQIRMHFGRTDVLPPEYDWSWTWKFKNRKVAEQLITTALLKFGA